MLISSRDGNEAAASSGEGAAHDRVYRALRSEILYGVMGPGAVLTLRGTGARFGVSMTPVREALRRLVAEGALTLSASGRVATPELSPERIEELAAIRALLEPELAARALARAHPALIERMRGIDSEIGRAIAGGDGSGYIRLNLEFHRALYLRAQAPAMLALAETVWLQLGPTMRALYGKLRRTEPPAGHRQILSALGAADEAALRRAVALDVTQGLRLLAR